MKHVVFLKAGNPYGYGYAAGETGLVRPTSTTKLNQKTGNDIVLTWGYDRLADLGVVREANKKEVEAYESTASAEKAATPPAA